MQRNSCCFLLKLQEFFSLEQEAAAMKKAPGVILCLILILGVCMRAFAAEGEETAPYGPVDASAEEAFLSSASPAELLFLRDQVSEMLISAPEYESVPVPVGVYQVGVDIPAGKWDLTADVRSLMTIGSMLEENGREIDTWNSDRYVPFMDLPFLKAYQYKENQLIRTIHQAVDFPDDYYSEFYVVVSKGTIHFSTYIGQPDFLFYASALPDKTVSQKLDLSAYDFSALVELRNRLNLAIWKSYPWDLVIVPAGLYQVNVDIPSGDWVIRAPEEFTRIAYGTVLKYRSMNLVIDDAWKQKIVNVTYRKYNPDEDVDSVYLTIADGAFLMIDENTCASFTPSSGRKPSLGFRQFASDASQEAGKEDQNAVYHLFTLDDTGLAAPLLTMAAPGNSDADTLKETPSPTPAPTATPEPR